MIRGLLATTLASATQALTGRLDQAAHSLLMMAHYTGRFASLLGARSARYVNKDDSGA